MRKLLFLLLLPTWGFSQVDSTAQVLSIDNFIQLVLTNHPVIKQSELVTEMAEAGVREARGQFDPKLTGSYDLKNFKDTEYWDLLNATLKFPLPIPIDPKISFDRNEGEFINNERSIPTSNENRQVSAGISLPIGKGLLIDERRNTLKQARIYQDIAQAEQIKMTNKILLTAIKDYWEWTLAYQEILLLQRSVAIAQELFERVLLDYGVGEAAVVDTIQAKITYQNRIVDYQNFLLDYNKSRLNLENHLWSIEQEPLLLQESTLPDTLADLGTIPDQESLTSLLESATTQHPELLKTGAKINQLEVERRWNREALKPEVDLKYSFIDAPITPFGDVEGPDSFTENYKLGVGFSYPLFLRKERGKLQKTNLKIETNQYELERKRLAIRNKVRGKFFEIQTSQELTSQYREMADSYQRLLQAEFLNLEVGESDLFKLNIQQDKFIESQLKYLKTLTKLRKNKVEILYEAGIPFLNLLPQP